MKKTILMMMIATLGMFAGCSDDDNQSITRDDHIPTTTITTANTGDTESGMQSLVRSKLVGKWECTFYQRAGEDINPKSPSENARELANFVTISADGTAMIELRVGFPNYEVTSTTWEIGDDWKECEWSGLQEWYGATRPGLEGTVTCKGFYGRDLSLIYVIVSDGQMYVHGLDFMSFISEDRGYTRIGE